ncbi:TPA: MurR/RpiR family transcriptional regulator [Escherichia coli]
MYSRDTVRKLNELEMEVYNYVIRNTDIAGYMTIRQLAEAVGVSTTTILRFCRKLECDGYAEFRVRLRLSMENSFSRPIDMNSNIMVNFFRSVDSHEFNSAIEKASNMLVSSERIIFIGIGTSGAMAKYGARLLSNCGLFSSYIDDPYYPASSNILRNTIAVVLSVSGETDEILRLSNQLISKKCKIISVTCNRYSRLSKLSDFNISWNMHQDRIDGGVDITTQIPVLYIIESICRRLLKG